MSRAELSASTTRPLPTSGSQRRPASDSMRLRVISVSVKPGATENAFTPLPSSDAASASVRLAMPAFPAA